MRLIDVGELKKRATKLMFRDAPECGEFDAVSVDDIDCIPTIDPESNPCESLRPTAHWKVDSGKSKNVACSDCNAISFAAYNYCPNCGARMVNHIDAGRI